MAYISCKKNYKKLFFCDHTCLQVRPYDYIYGTKSKQKIKEHIEDNRGQF